MSAAHLPLRLNGDNLGDLITVGDQVMLFTVRPDLAGLDGRTFASVEAARDAVAAQLTTLVLIRGLAA